MEQLHIFIIRNYIWITFLCLLGTVWYLLQIFSRSAELRRSVFMMERERALSERNRSALLLFFFLITIGYIAFVVSSIAPVLARQGKLSLPTPTPNYVSTALASTPLAISPQELPTPTLLFAPTATLRNASDLARGVTIEAPTRIPPLNVPILSEGCTEQVQIDQPVAGATLAQTISVFGRVESAELAYFGVEIRGPYTGDLWEALGETKETSISNGYLGGGDVSTWDNGIYQLRVMAWAENDDLLASCLIQIGLNNASTTTENEGE